MLAHTPAEVAVCPQTTVGKGQSCVTPLAQEAPLGEALPHAPQLLGSVIKFRHTLPLPIVIVFPKQLVIPVGQVLIPFTHVPPLDTTNPHEPQLDGSDWVFTHEEPPHIRQPVVAAAVVACAVVANVVVGLIVVA